MPLSLPEDENQSFFQRLESWFFENRAFATIALLGLIILGSGLFLMRSGFFEGTKVEILEKSGGGEGVGGQVTVEIAGAVEKPGVYKLLASERVERLLIEAGGLSAEADREWVEKNLNRAAKLVDGQKIYIPRIGESTTSSMGTTSITGRINLNTASVSELDNLSGIGVVRAKAIVENRPYASINELVTKKIISQSVFDKIKDEVVAP